MDATPVSLGLRLLAPLYLCSTDAVYKATKTSANGDVKTNARATVKDQDEDDDDDVVAGPEMPPDEEEPLPDDDDEGRFFGGGITKNTADVMDFIEEQGNDETVCLDAYAVDLDARLMGVI